MTFVWKYRKLFSSHQIDVLQAEVLALKTLVLSSSPTSPCQDLPPGTKTPFKKGHGRNKSTSSAMLGSQAELSVTQPIVRDCREVGQEAAHCMRIGNRRVCVCRVYRDPCVCVFLRWTVCSSASLRPGRRSLVCRGAAPSWRESTKKISTPASPSPRAMWVCLSVNY